MKIILFITLISLSFSTIAQTPLTANAGSDQVICSAAFGGIESHFIGGQPSASGGIPPYTYSWSFACSPPWTSDTSYASDFFNDTTLSNPTLIRMDIKNWPQIPPFVLTVTDNNGEIAVDSVQLFMSRFDIFLILYGLGITQGDTIYSDIPPDVVGGTGPISWLWKPNHGLIDSTHFLFIASPSHSINYYVTATDSLGCSQQGQIDFIQVEVFPVGIEDGIPNTTIKVYPNPASDFIHIERIENATIEQFILYDMLGKEVLRSALNQTTETIDISNLARGNYSFVIGKDQGKIILR